MSVADPGRAYDAGALAVSLCHCEKALTDAFVAAARLEVHDSPLVESIIAAQDAVAKAQRQPRDWHKR